MKKNILLFIGCFFAFYSCKSTSNLQSSHLNIFNKQEKEILEYIIEKGLQREAIYTIYSPIKPMSTIGDYRVDYKLEYSDSKFKAQIDTINLLESIVENSKFKPIEFQIYPFNSTWDSIRTYHFCVLRKDLVSKLLEDKKDFFSSLSINQDTDYKTMLIKIENANMPDRYRALGYLFGYPDYAVDFFVEASVKGKESGELVPRQFFQIPTLKSKTGHFVYALPLDYKIGQADSLLYKKAEETLEKFKRERAKQSFKKGIELIKELDGE